MSYLSPGLLEAYNSLTDKHLVGYFNNTRIRRHLRRAGLITRSGRIVPEKEYRQKLIHRAHQRHVRECLAQAIFHKVLDMERAHQTEIKKRLEEFARRERVYKIKVERSKRHDDDFIPMLSPRPPTGPRGNHTQQSGPEGEMSESSESPGSSRPNTAPGKMQRPVRLKPIGRNSTTASIKRTPSSSRNQDSSNDTDQPPSLDRDMRHWTMREYNSTVSPYRLPVINNFVTPVPPQTKRRERSMKGPLIGTRGRRLRPTTAPSVPANTEDCALLRTSMQSKVTVTMVYFGRSVHLSHDLIELGDEVKVFQQHCGGENLCVYKGRLREGETFQFISRRHRGFPFSLTFYLNGLQVDRLSSCCEFKHRKGSRLGGRHGHFGFFGVDGAQPCYKCIIVMGLDKKPTPPPKRASDDTGISPAIELCPETTLEQAEVQENQVEEKELETETDSTQPLCLKTEEEAMQDDQPKDDYEEDFEADDEGPVEDGGDGGDGKSPSPTNEGKMEDEIQDAPVGEQAEHKHPGSESEDEDKAAQKDTRSVSSEGASSCSGSDAENSEVEAETKEDDATEQTKASEAIPQADPETEPPLPMETSDKHQQDEDAEMTEVSSPVPPEAAATAEAAAHTEAQDCGSDNPDQTELEVSDSTDMEATAAAAAASASEGMADTAGGSAEETEPERAKSVQEKLAEAILNEAHSSPEPELSDTSTEEEEEESEKTPQDTTALEPETGVALSLLQPEKEELKECEKNPEEILNEETDVQAGEERGPSPENKDNQGPDEQNVEAEEPEVENEKTEEQQEELEPIDECSKETLEISANPDGEKTEETESNEADETPCEAETKVETEDQDIKENAKEQTEESSTFANETESTSLENKEENAKEINETHDSEDPLEEQEKEEEEKKNTEETAEGDPGASETEAQKTSEEPSESAMAVSGVPQSEEPSADDTKREEGTPDDQDGATDNGAAGADDATAYDATSYDATARDDGSSGEKSMAQEANYETSEKTSTTNVVGKENEENSDEKLVDGKKDQQDTEEKDKAEEEQPVNVDEGNKDIIQQISEYESEALDKEEKIVDELKEDKDRPLVTVENVETVQEQVKPDTGEQSEEDKAEEVAKETDIPEARDEHAENEVKVVEEDAKSSVSDGGKEKPKEDKNDTEDKAVDREERDSVSEGEKDKSVECEEEKKLDVKEHEGQEAGADLGDTPVEAKADIEDSPVDTIAEKDGGKVTDEEVDKPVIEQVNEREVETEPAEKEDEQDGEEQKKEKIQHEQDQLECAEQDTEPKVSGDTTVAEDAEEDSVPKDGRAKVDDEMQTLKDTEVEEVEHPEKDTAEVVERDDTDRDVQGEDKHDVMFNMGNTIVHNTTVSGDGTESQHSMNAEAKDEVVEVKTKQISVFEFAIREVREQQQDDIEINDENGEKITASETIGNVVKTSEVQEFQQNIDTEQTGSSDRGEEKTKDTLEEIVEDKQNDLEDMNGDDTKSDRKLSSEGSAATQVKVEERKVNDDDDDHASVLSKTSKDNVSRHSLSKQDQDLANSDKQIEETSSAVQPFHIVQEAEGLNTINTNGTMSDTPGGTGSDLETKLHKSKPKDLEGKEDTSTKTDSREPDGTVKESKEDKVNGEQSVVESLVSPLPLELEEAGDLVSKWVNQHQSRGCFQTFVEPLDDMKETSSLSKGDGHINGSLEKGEGSQVTNMPDSDTLDQVSEKKEDYGSSPMSSLTEIKQETTVKDFVMETAEEKAESDVRSKHSNDESALATKDMLDEVQDEEIRDLTAETKYAKEDTTNITTKDKENQPYEQGVVSDRVIDLIAIMKTKDDSRADSESLPESASHAKTDNSVHSLHAQDTTMTKQQLRLEDAMPQSLSRDRLSTFSVEDSNLFGPTTYPRLATAHPEQSY